MGRDARAGHPLRPDQRSAQLYPLRHVHVRRPVRRPHDPRPKDPGRPHKALCLLRHIHLRFAQQESRSRPRLQSHVLRLLLVQLTPEIRLPPRRQSLVAAPFQYRCSANISIDSSKRQAHAAHVQLSVRSVHPHVPRSHRVFRCRASHSHLRLFHHLEGQASRRGNGRAPSPSPYDATSGHDRRGSRSPRPHVPSRYPAAAFCIPSSDPAGDVEFNATARRRPASVSHPNTASICATYIRPAPSATGNGIIKHKVFFIATSAPVSLLRLLF